MAGSQECFHEVIWTLFAQRGMQVCEIDRETESSVHAELVVGK